MAGSKKIKIDSNIKRLVSALNKLPGICTFSSCGGHAKITNESQRPKGEFDINFDVQVLEGGWRSLQYITWCAVMTDHNRLTITTWLTTIEDPASLAFELAGVDGIDPNVLADLIAKNEWPDDDS